MTADQRTAVLGHQVVVEDGDTATFLSAVEVYEIIDPDLPYADRFRTVAVRLEVDSDTDQPSFILNLDRRQWLTLAQQALAAVDQLDRT